MEFRKFIMEAGRKTGRGERMRYFFSVLGILLAGQLVISAWPYFSSISTQEKLVESSGRHLNDAVRQYFTDQISLITGDLNYLAAQYAAVDAYVPDYRRKKALLEIEFANMLRNKLVYDQIRIINTGGMEQLRVNFNNGKLVILPPQRYQDKAKRYYFLEGIKLARDEMYISPFDLNIEDEKIEQPLKPTIRFIVPVFSARGRRDGILVINYLGANLIESARMLRKSHSFLSNNNGSLLMILNAGGYFILGAKASDEWGFMFPDRKHFRFQNAFPEVWETVAGKDHGSIGTSRGFFAFSTIKMDPEVRLKKVVAAESFWKVVSFTPASALHELTGGIRRRYLILNVFFTILSMVIAFTITVLNSIRRNAERELMLMASTDPLTGLLNRRAFLERFEYERVRSSRYDERISVILADIDHFKRVNDTLGHEAGDYVLRVIADLLRKNLREQDSICRWGGEEFIVLLPMTDLESAVETAEKLRRVVEIFRFEHKAVPIMVTMSFGVALHAPGAPVGECVQRADSHMYESKSTGRNRVSADR